MLHPNSWPWPVFSSSENYQNPAKSNAMAESEVSYGKRLLPTYVAEVARTDPDRLIYNIPNDRRSYAEGLRRITFRDFERIVDRLAWMLEEKLGKSEVAETLAYIGPNDIRYFALLIAVPKAGYKLLLSSPRNSVSNHLHLLEKTSCSTFLKAASISISHIEEASPNPLRSIDIPELDDLLVNEDVLEYPYNRTFEDVKSNQVLILHSSGSTGQVKPIFHTYRSFAACDCHHFLKDENGRGTVPTEFPEGGIFLPMPFFHGAAIFQSLLNLWFQKPTTVYPPDVPVSLAGIMQALRCLEIPAAILAPALLEEASQSEEMLQILGKLTVVIYAGGSINERAASSISKHVNLQNYIGTTEAGGYPVYPHSDFNNDHAYLKFKPGESGIEFRHLTDNLYELIFVRRDGPQYNPTFDAFPDAKEYATSDLYTPHPTKPGLWKHSGRADDVIVLSNGEKVAPSFIESTLCQAPMVRRALLYGEKRFEVSAIIELDGFAQSLPREELIKQLHPHIERANKEAPSHAQLSPDRIVFARHDEPFMLSPKGSVVRKPTFNLYEKELDEVYSNLGSVELLGKPLLHNVSEDETIAQLSLIIAKIAQLEALSADEDFFQMGVDSLKVVTIVRQVKAHVGREDSEVPSEKIENTLIYSNPTVRSLARALRNIKLGNDTGFDERMQEQVKGMKQMIDDYSKDLPPNNSARKEELSVILTGSTGSLGSYLLDALLADKRVVRVFCMNRSADAQTKQLQSSSARGLGLLKTCGERVQFLHADLSKPLLGLEKTVYDRVVQQTTHIIHTQWPVNFNIQLRTFEPHVRGLRNLIDLAAAAPNRPSLLFVSSISVASNWARGDPVPESQIADAHVPGANGYAASKYVSEGLLVAAAKKSGVRALIVRVGQLAGAVDKGSGSIWNKDEWFPSMIASSYHLGVVPTSLGPFLDSVEFVPVDRGAQILLDLSLSDRISSNDNQAVFFNMVNPHPVSYSSLVPELCNALETAPKLVPLAEWVETLRDSSKGDQVDLQKNPAVKLLGFYESLCTGSEAEDAKPRKNFSTERTEEWSTHMRGLEAVKPEWMRAWVKGLDL